MTGLLITFPNVAVCWLWHLDQSCLHHAVPLSEVWLLILICSGFDLAWPLDVTQMWPHYQWLTWLVAVSMLSRYVYCHLGYFLFMFRACFFKLIGFLPIKCAVLSHQTLMLSRLYCGSACSQHHLIPIPTMNWFELSLLCAHPLQCMAHNDYCHVLFSV